MKARRHTFSVLACSFAVAIAWLVAGCQGSRFSTEWQMHRSQILEVTRGYAAREATAMENLRHIADVARESRTRHAQCLRDTVRMIGVESQHDVRLWREESPVRRDRLRTMLKGEPAGIPEFIADTVY